MTETIFSWTELWAYLAGEPLQAATPAGRQGPQAVWGYVEKPVEDGIQVKLDTGGRVLVPLGHLKNARPQTRVRLHRDMDGTTLAFQQQPHARHYVPLGPSIGIPSIPVIRTPQRFQFLWAPSLNRLHVDPPAFSAVQVAEGYSQDSPLFSEPLSDPGWRHSHFLSFEAQHAWQKVDHQARTAFQPDYASFILTDLVRLPNVPEPEHIVPNLDANRPYLPPPVGDRALSAYLAGFPQITTSVVSIDDQAFLALGDALGPAVAQTQVVRQGNTLDYQTGTETLDTTETTVPRSDWRAGTLYIESWEYLDPPLTVPRRTIKYRSAASKLRIVMHYQPQYNGWTGQYEMEPHKAQWQGYDSHTGQWWPVGNIVEGYGLESYSLGNLPPAGGAYADDQWVDPIPSCNPATGEYDALTAFRRGPEFANGLVPVAYPNGATLPEPEPVADWRPFFTSPDLQGSFVISEAETFPGHGERLKPSSEVKVNGEVIPGPHLFWAAVRHVQPEQPDHQTLLLCGEETITLLQDLGDPLILSWPDFWEALGLLAGLQFKTASSPYAHHSFPLDRCYLGAALDGQDYVIGIAHLDPWRDLTMQDWAVQDLQKPRTREEYLQHVQEGKPLPQRDVGLVCSDVIPMTLPLATKPGYAGPEPLTYHKIPFQSLPIARGSIPQGVPVQVEILGFVGTAEELADAQQKALEVVSRKWDLWLGWEGQDESEDRLYLSEGLYRLTFDPILVWGSTGIQLLGRGKGNLDALTVESPSPPNPQKHWLGPGLKPTTEGQEIPALGWRPFSFTVPAPINPTEGLVLDVRVGSGFQLSQLIWTVTAIQNL